MAQRGLVIKCIAGIDDAERCAQAFTVAATAVASGVSTSLWLTGEASWFALPGKAQEFDFPHAAPLADLLAAINEKDLIDGIKIAGAASFLAEIIEPDVQALVY
jgi:predicted peroxiredoxin